MKERLGIAILGLATGMGIGLSPMAQAWLTPLGIHRDNSARLSVAADEQQINLPQSTATGLIPDGPFLAISSTRITLDGNQILELEEDPRTGMTRIPTTELDPNYRALINGEHSLTDALEQERERQLAWLAQLGEGRGAQSLLQSLFESPVQRKGGEFEGQINLLIDRDIPFDVLGRVLYTSGHEQFRSFSFIVDNPELGERMAIHSFVPLLRHSYVPSDDYVEPFELILMVQKNGLDIRGSKSVTQLVFDDPRPRDSVLLDPLFGCTDGQQELEVCTSVEVYDWQALAEILVEIKQAHSAGDSRAERIIIMPDHGVSYEVMVRALDVTRDGAGLVELNRSWTALPQPGDINYLEDRSPPVLFPRAIIGGGRITE